MVAESRVRKSWLNAKVNFIFYFLTLVANFISRKVFLDQLGADFVGLTGTLLNILGYLNLAELGVSSAISFNLYKPLKDGNHEKISKVMSLMGYYYKNIGLIVAASGIGVSIFLWLIFKDSAFRDYGVIYFAFYSYLISALLGYFMNYKQIVLVADQRNYVVTSLYQTSNILKAGVQIGVAIWLHNFYLWIAIELLFSLAYSLVLNRRIRQVYPWLSCRIKEGKKISREMPEILKSTKQVFIHKIKDFLLTQSDQLFVFIFVSLKMVAYYGNYVLVTTKAMQLFNQLLDSVLAGVGNLVAENDIQRMTKVFWELSAIRYFLAGFLSYLIYRLIDPFIILWVGQEYLLGPAVVILLCLNLFIMISRGTVDNFNFAFGHFADVWSAWTELILNVGVTIVGGYMWGIPGILLGKTLSMLPIIVFWKPYYLFRDGFALKYRTYWRGVGKYLVCLVASIVVCELIMNWLGISFEGNLSTFVFLGITLCVIFGGVYGCGIAFLCPGGRHLLLRIRNK